jgi:glycosyltransferase involved in cell wall biosynthesis
MGGAAGEASGTGLRAVSVVIPALDEEATLERVVREVAAVFARELPALRLELVVVDDGSRDSTPELVAKLAAQMPALRSTRHPSPRGKGAALRSGFALCTGDVVVIQDADLEYQPGDIPRLLSPIGEGVADAVYGSRFVSPERRVNFFWTTLANRIVTWLTDAALNANFTDVYTGYKAMRRDYLQRIELESDDFTVEVELTAKLRRLGARFYEVPIRYHARTWAEGKKIRALDALRAVVAVLRFRFGPVSKR